MTVMCPPDQNRLGTSTLVLLVDDDPTGRQSIAQLLSSVGHSCVDVESGFEALRFCEGLRPHLVITDLCMPGLDGRGLAARLRDRFPEIALILITAQPLDEPFLTDLRSTFDEVLSKPVDCDRLLAQVSLLAQ
jgi:CheY-like chemotaxis protein